MNTKHWTLVLALCVVSTTSGGCLKDKALDLVVTGETYADFPVNATDVQWIKYVNVDFSDQIRQILKENGYDESDIKSAHVTSVSYGVTSFEQAHDWTLSGSIHVSTTNGVGLSPILGYNSQSVRAALGRKISAPLVENGVTLVNEALADFIAGENPVLTFAIENQSATPLPSGGDPMIFTWRAWLAIQVILKQEVTVPDPF